MAPRLLAPLGLSLVVACGPRPVRLDRAPAPVASRNAAADAGAPAGDLDAAREAYIARLQDDADPGALPRWPDPCHDVRVADAILASFERWSSAPSRPDGRRLYRLARDLACGPTDPGRLARVWTIGRTFPDDDVRSGVLTGLGEQHPDSAAIQELFLDALRTAQNPAMVRLALLAVARMRAGDDAKACDAVLDRVALEPGGLGLVASAEPAFVDGARCASSADAFYRLTPPDFVPTRAFVQRLASLCTSGEATTTTRERALAVVPTFEASAVPDDHESAKVLRCACAAPAKRGKC